MTAHDRSDGNTGKPVSVLSGERSTAETETEIEAADERNQRVVADPGRGTATDPGPATLTSLAGRAWRLIDPTRSSRRWLVFTAMAVKYASQLLQSYSRSLAVMSGLSGNLPKARSKNYKKRHTILMQTA